MTTRKLNSVKIPFGMTATFNQLSAFILILIIIGVLVHTRADCPDGLRQALMGAMTLATGYIWGSSTGSHAKDDTIANSTPIVPSPVTDPSKSTTTTSITEEK